VMMAMLTEAELAKAEATVPTPSAPASEATVPAGEVKVKPEAKGGKVE